jgi:Tol biopolymer transport system component
MSWAFAFVKKAIGETMRVRKIKYLVFFIFVTACTQMRSINLPEGITLLKDVDRSGLQSPIWSPDGKQIVASYIIRPMPDIAGIFGDKPRYDIVTIDTNTWKTTILASQESGDFSAQVWLPDGKGFAMNWSDGYDKNGIYLFDVDGTKSTYLSHYGVLSPDINKIADFNDPYVLITDIHTRDVVKFKVPVIGIWYVNSWSPDMKQLVLIYQKNESERYYDIYLLDVNLGIFTQFTNDKDYYKYSPTFSPDGQLIAYSAHRFFENKIDDKLLISTLDHSCEWTMPVSNIYEFAWSPDSKKMFMVGTDGVYVVDLNVVYGSDFASRNLCP